MGMEFPGGIWCYFMNVHDISLLCSASILPHFYCKAFTNWFPSIIDVWWCAIAHNSRSVSEPTSLYLDSSVVLFWTFNIKKDITQITMIQQRAARFVPTRDSVSTMLVDRISETDELTHNMSCPSKSWQNQAEVKISFLAYILKAWSNYTIDLAP